MTSGECAISSIPFLAKQAGWATANQVAQILLAFAGLAIMTRILGPEPYGVFALGMTFVGLVEIVTGGHTADFLVQRADLRHGHENAAVVSASAVALTAFLIGVFGTSLTAGLFDTPEVAGILPLLSVLPLLGALGNVPIARLTRELRFESMAKIDFFCHAAAFLTGVGGAVVGMGVWSLPLMEIVRRSVRLVLMTATAGWQPRFGFDRRDFGELWSFSRSRILSTALAYVSVSAPRVLIGGLLGTSVLGYYVVAGRLVDQFSNLLIYPLSAIAFPAASKLRDDLPRLRKLLEGAMRVASNLIWPAILGFNAIAPLAVPLVLGQMWASTTLIVQLLTLVALRSTVSAFCASIFLSCGQPGIQTKLDLLDLVMTVSAIVVGAQFGIEGVAFAIVAKSFLLIPAVCFYIRQLIHVSIKAQLYLLFSASVPAALMAATVSLVGFFLPIADPGLSLVVLILTGVVSHVVFWSLFNLRTVRIVVRSVRQGLRGDHNQAAVGWQSLMKWS